MAILFLQSFDSFDIFAEFDTETGKIARRSKTESGREPARISGQFSEVAGGVWCLYRAQAPDGNLHVRFDARDITLKKGVAIELVRRPSVNVLSVVNNGKEVLTKRYAEQRPEPPLELDPTPFVEDEDFDFGLFLRNVSQDEGRRTRIFTESET